jgi:tRNA-splicing ligase RtcB
MIQKVVMGTRLPAKLWLDDVEQSCMEQIVNLASLPFAFKHIAIMPDAHMGMGMPIGGVLATKGVVVPNAVGVDIGCGMCAMKTNLKAQQLTHGDLTSVMSYIRETVPLGFDHQKEAVDETLLPDVDIECLPFLKNKKEKMLYEIGTLGGGNHFIEIQKDTKTDDVWAMVHSGSRHTGLQVAVHYNKLAEYWCGKWFAEMLPKLAFLPFECQVAKDYYAEMNFCIQLALANRSAIMERIKEAFCRIRPEVEFDPMINIAHNYAAWEKHFNENVIVHRKGATRARKGEIGIIPGSMGTKSYIVEGLGNENSFESCSHGAGRRMSRSAAFRTLSLEDECRKMDEKGIIHGMRKSVLDEAPSAYKDIEKVLAFESDLVKPLIELVPMAVIKGE